MRKLLESIFNSTITKKWYLTPSR